MGRKRLNRTIEEIREQTNVRSKRWYQRNKQRICEERMRRYWEQKTKKCFHCQKTLPLENFNKLFVSKDGYLSSCRECRKEIVKRSCEKAKITHPWKLRNRENQYRKDNPVKTWASSSLYKHRKKYQVDISVKELEEIGKATSHCSICDCRLSWGGNFVVKDSSPSLDRVDNEHIISKENIQIICHRCNCTKRDRTMKEFLDYCRAMVEKFGNQ